MKGCKTYVVMKEVEKNCQNPRARILKQKKEGK